jgi:hypothetical protein
MAAADDQRAGDEQAEERSAGEHRLSLAEWLVLPPQLARLLPGGSWRP